MSAILLRHQASNSFIFCNWPQQLTLANHAAWSHAP